MEYNQYVVETKVKSFIKHLYEITSRFYILSQELFPPPDAREKDA
jgi:hypothetical protein